ncbi:MAG TPA: YqaA family protein [Syntrophorhabdaceae bacterium]|nr:YqaA family protein [Syntrophorhabdaceae bacterium]HOL05858.1 YqaA family protein [Syntrophorhabdaceae bacterium]HPP42307.1 YqaA family protein [Syntrophorhabdaceae bacterium]
MEHAVTAKQNIIKRLYDWVLHWAETPYGTPALFILAFTESSFFPVPPDVLLIALCLSIPTRSFYYAFICSIGSVLGGAFGYLIGITFMDTIGMKILAFYGFNEQYTYVQQLYMKYDAWAVGIAGFTPIPYKVFTISAGAFKISFPVFIIASVISRSLRFFIVAGLIYIFGKPIKGFIDRYFNLLCIIFTVLLIGGFIVIRYLF